jgi:DNA-binding transcriptional regulator YdaS (Cro superfamily)
MLRPMTNEAISRAVNHVGGQSALARAVGVSQATVWYWVHKMSRVPAEFVVAVETATNGAVTRHDLRPDIFGPSILTDPRVADAPARAGDGVENRGGGEPGAATDQPSQEAA